MTKVRMASMAAGRLRLRRGREGRDSGPPLPGPWSYGVSCAFLKLDDQLRKTVGKEG